MTQPDPSVDLDAQRITRDWMRHLGYTAEQIAESERPPDHSRCDLTPEGYDCIDEDGKDTHPVHVEANHIAEFALFVLAALRDAGWKDAEGVRLLREYIEAVHEIERNLKAELAAEREAHSRLWQQRDEAITERDRLRPVVDAARALIAAGARPGRELHIDGPILRETFRALVAAVDAYDAREATRTDE